MRYRLDVVAPTVLDAVRFAGGWIYDRVMAGWDVTVLVNTDEDVRPLEILGAEARDLESVLESWDDRPHPQTVAVAADLFGRDDRVRRGRARRTRTGRDRGDAVGRAAARRTGQQCRFRAAPTQRGRPRVQGSGARGRERSGGRRRSATPRRSAAARWRSVAADLIPAS